MPSDEQRGKGPVTATNDCRNGRATKALTCGSPVVGGSFGPKQQTKTAGMACQGGSSKMLSLEVSSPLAPSHRAVPEGAQGQELVQQRQVQSRL